jgi:hypothetical protein
VSNLHELVERLITPQQAFTQIWQVERYGQFKIHGSIINVPTNVNRTQFILPHMLNDEATIGLILKHKLEYKSPYLSRNIRLNQVMLALRDLVTTPLYINAKISIKLMWEDMFNIAKIQQSKNHLNTLQETKLDMEQSSYKFEEITKKLSTYTLVQNFLSPNQSMNNENIITMPLVKTTNHLDFSKTKIANNVINPHYFLECFENLQFWPNFGIRILFNGNSCIKIIDLLNTYQTYFFKAIKVFIQ